MLIIYILTAVYLFIRTYSHINQ